MNPKFRTPAMHVWGMKCNGFNLIKVEYNDSLEIAEILELKFWEGN